MRDSKTYSDWWHNAYLKEFPKPFRNESVWSADDVNCCQFSMLDQVQYEMEYQFDRESFIKFMMIQSNVNAKIEGEGRSIEDILNQGQGLADEIRQYCAFFLQGNIFGMEEKEYAEFGHYVLQVLEDYMEAVKQQDMLYMLDTLDNGLRELLNIYIDTDADAEEGCHE